MTPVAGIKVLEIAMSRVRSRVVVSRRHQTTVNPSASERSGPDCEEYHHG
jgi:hypothetical protein